MTKKKPKPCPIDDHSACAPLMDLARGYRNDVQRVEGFGELLKRLERRVDAIDARLGDTGTDRNG